MTRAQLIQAMSLMNYELDIDYTINLDYASISMIDVNITKPLEVDLQVAYDAWDYLVTLPDRVQVLGDISLLLDTYFQQNSSLLHNGDNWNPATFDVDKFDTNWGWRFQELPKPTINQLETIKSLL